MTDTNPFQWETDPTTHDTPDANQRNTSLEYFVAEYEDRPDELAFVPRDPDGDVPTQWITINANDALSLEDWR